LNETAQIILLSILLSVVSSEL